MRKIEKIMEKEKRYLSEAKEMVKRYAIFDMDGTLIDSMPVWKNLARHYLLSKGIAAHEDLNKAIEMMTLIESAVYLKERFLPESNPEGIVAEMLALLDEQYRDTIPLKEGVLDYLRHLKNEGMILCVATASARPLAEACLSRLGIRNFFKFILSCEDMGIGKHRPDIYLHAAECFGVAVQEIAVFEDALYAAETAKNAGFYTVGIYDDAWEAWQDQLQSLCDQYILSYYDELEKNK